MQGLIDIFKPERTFRPQKKFTRDSKRGLLFEKAQATLGLQLCMSDMVVVPPGEDKCEWIAVHAVDFFNRISLIFGTLTDACLTSTCPAMSHSNGSKVGITRILINIFMVLKWYTKHMLYIFNIIY